MTKLSKPNVWVFLLVVLTLIAANLIYFSKYDLTGFSIAEKETIEIGYNFSQDIESTENISIMYDSALLFMNATRGEIVLQNKQFKEPMNLVTAKTPEGAELEFSTDNGTTYEKTATNITQLKTKMILKESKSIAVLESLSLEFERSQKLKR